MMSDLLGAGSPNRSDIKKSRQLLAGIGGWFLITDNTVSYNSLTPSMN